MDVPMSASQQSMGALMEEPPLQKIPVIGARSVAHAHARGWAAPGRRWPQLPRRAACVPVAQRRWSAAA
jgi:hypothetical protein